MANKIFKDSTTNAVGTICFINTIKTWGGGEKWHFEMSLYLHRIGYKVLVITGKNTALFNNLKLSTVPCMELDVNNLSFLNTFKVNAFKKLLKSEMVKTVVISASRDLKFGGISAKKAGVPRIIYARSIPVPIKNSHLNRYLFKNVVTDIVANSNATKISVLKQNPLLFPEKKIKVLYHGIQIDEFTANEVGHCYEKIDNDEIVLVTLGRLELEKNHKFLIYLARELKERGIKFKILIGGKGSLLKDLTELAHRIKVAEKVVFMGFIANPKDLIACGDIFVLPSLWEGFGYVLVEAALCKKPIIAFDTTSIPEIMVRDSTGFIIPLDNIKAFADKVEYLAGHRQAMVKMGKEGRVFAVKNFDSKLIFKQFAEYVAQ